MPTRHAAQVVTIHDLFFLDHPERTRAEIRRDYPDARRPARPSRRRRHHVDARTRETSSSTRLRRAAGTDLRLPARPSRLEDTRPRAESASRRLHPVYRHPRAPEEYRYAARRLHRPARASARCAAARACGSRDAGRGPVAGPARDRRRFTAGPSTSATCPTTSRNVCTPARARWCCHRSTKDSASPCWRPCQPVSRWSPRAAARCRRWLAMAARSSTPTDPRALSLALERVSPDPRVRACAGAGRSAAGAGLLVEHLRRDTPRRVRRGRRATDTPCAGLTRARGRRVI